MGAAIQLKGQVKFALEVVKGPHIGVRLDFTKDVISIGRGPENDLVLSSDPHASRAHAEIRRRGPTEFVIVNVSQKNFVIVNGNVIESEVITPDSEITIGETEIRCYFESASLPVAPTVPAAPRPVAVPRPAMPQVAPQMTPQQAPSFPTAPSSPSPQTPNYYQNPPPASPPAPAGASGGLLENPKVRFYGIIGILVLVGFFLFSPSKKDKVKDRNEIRTSTVSMQDYLQAEKRSQELLTIKKEKIDSVQYRRAQENFVKGFRDFQQGQYARAREAFQVVLNLDPDNELARRYYNLSKIKFDELVKFNMIQGNRYREKRNWRMCQSSYQNVMTMLFNRKEDPSYKEAKQFFDECFLNMEGRF